MSTVDNRIVKMSMDSGQFTSAANSTMNTLKKLGDSLKLTDGAKGLENIASKANNVNMDSLAASVDVVKQRFSALDIIGVTALVNITNSAINAGKNLVKSLTLDPVMQGFSEYETKMNSITTIMTNTAHAGTTMSDVTAALDELNLYADKTIYSFSEMTKNIGTFTAAGVDLKTSTMAIKGIANLAAGSGSTAVQASTAMYQLSQSIASGKVNLQDWNSVVNAGMGGKLFQDALKETGKLMGANIDEAQTFRDSISADKGTEWLTSDILLATLQKFSEDPSLLKAATQVKTFTSLLDTMKESVQSGWSQSWENIIGDKDQASEFFTAVSEGFTNIVGPMADYRNESLKLWKDDGGRDAVLKGLSATMKTIGDILGPVYQSFKKIIDPWNGEQLISMSKGFQKMAESIQITDKTSALISRTFDGLFSVVSIVGKVIGGVVSAFASFLPLLSPIVDGILSITAVMGDYAVGINEFLGSTNVFKGIIDIFKGAVSGIANFIGDGLELIAKGIGSIKNIDVSGLKTVADKIIDCFSPIEGMGIIIGSVIDGIKSAINKFIPVAAEFASKVWSTMSKVSQAIIDTMGGKGNALQNIMNTGLLAAIGLGISKIFKFFKGFKADVGGIVDSIIGVFDGVKDSIESFQNGIKADTLKKIAVSIGILAASLLIISTIDSAKLISSLTAMGVMFGELVGAMALLDKVGGGVKVGIGMVVLSTSILILAGALKTIEDISWENSAKGLLSIGAMIGMLVGVSKTMEKNSKGMIKSSIAMVIFSAGINVLSKAVKSIGELDPSTITKGLIGIGLLMTELSLFMKATDFSGMGVLNATGILILAQSLKVMSDAIGMMGSLDPSTIMKGLAGIGAVLLEISLFMKLIGNPAGMISTSIAMGILGGALLILSSAIEKMGNLNVSVIGTGLYTMGAALAIIAGAMRLLPKDMMAQSISLVILSGALIVLSKALSSMGGMEWTDIGRGLTVLGGSLLILAIAMKAMQGSIGGAAALVVTAGAIALLTPSLMLLGSMSIESIGKSLLMLAGTFTVLGIAGLVLTPITPVLIALGIAVGLLGVACLAVGVGISAFAAGLGLLAVSGTAGAAALVVIITSIVGLIPMIAIALAEGLVSIIKVFADNTAILVKSITGLAIALVESLTAAIPAIMDLISTIVVSILNYLIEVTPKLVETVVTVIMAILEALTTNIPLIAEMVVESLLTLIETVLTKLAEGIPKIASAITDVIVAIITAIGDGVPRVVEAIFDFIIKMINGLTDAVSTKMPEVRSAIKGLVTAIIDEFKAAIKDAVSVGGDIVQGLANGIKSGLSWVTNAAKDVASSALKGAKNLLGIKSPSREFMKVGMYSDQGMAKGFEKHSGLVENSAIGVAEGALSGMRSALATVNELFDTDIDSQPVIRPVLDLSEIKAGAGSVNGLFNKQTIKLGYNDIGGRSVRQIGPVNPNSAVVQNGDVVDAIHELKDALGGATGGDSYNLNGITYDDGSNVSNAIKSLVRATKIERRI